jgi:hypothetical protein
VSAWLLAVLIGAVGLGVLMVALCLVSIWRGRLPYLSDVVVVLVVVALVMVHVWREGGA